MEPLNLTVMWEGDRGATKRRFQECSRKKLANEIKKCRNRVEGKMLLVVLRKLSEE